MIQSAVNSIAGTLAKAIIGREVMKTEEQKKVEGLQKELKKNPGLAGVEEKAPEETKIKTPVEVAVEATQATPVDLDPHPGDYAKAHSKQLEEPGIAENMETGEKAFVSDYGPKRSPIILANEALKFAQMEKRVGKSFNKTQLDYFRGQKSLSQAFYLRQATNLAGRNDNAATSTLARGAKREKEWNEVMKK